MKLVFATNNEHKIGEINNYLAGRYKILTLRDVNINEDIPENEDSLEGNAMSKARYVYDKTGMNVFADDTGLEVRALGNSPGVKSARYAGDTRSSEDNINKLLHELGNSDDRKARFRTVIALILEGREHLFEGIVEGVIITERRGSSGFGYDPVFVADGMQSTFAEITLDEKNSISHRARAMQKLSRFLEQQLIQ